MFAISLMICLINEIANAIDENLFVFLDLSKAFYITDHSILLKKLEFCGLTGIALDWVKCYTSDR